MEQNIILLFGSDSNERLVSVASAQALALALGSVTLYFWHKNGSIYQPSLAELLGHENPFTSEFIPQGKPSFNSIEDLISSPDIEKYTFVLATHGGKGENGYLQALLEKRGCPFTGSNAKSSARAFDKIATKEHLLNFPIKMAPHIILPADANKRASMLEDFLSKNEKIVVKPVSGGSSIDCHFIRYQHEIAAALAALSEGPYMAEKLLCGRELTVGVIETPQGLLSLPVAEIELQVDRDFDYDGKYLGRGTREVIPANIEESIGRDAQRMALAAHAALELEGYSRTDMIFTSDGHYYLETNTLPGLTKQSFVPQQLAAANITLREFLTYQISLAQTRALGA